MHKLNKRVILHKNGKHTIIHGFPTIKHHKIMTSGKCLHSHLQIIIARRRLLYTQRKRQLLNRIKRTNKKCKSIRKTFKSKKIKMQ